jgi:hypothetical protein
MVRALDWRPGDQGSNLSSAIRAKSWARCLLACAHVNQVFHPSGVDNWYQPRVGLTFSVRLPGRRVGVLAAVSGCGRANPS